MSQEHIDALRSSVARLHNLTASMSEAELTGRAYPKEWTIAQVLSHIGSGAVIMQRRLDDSLAGRETPDDYAPGVWETWNAKVPTGQRDDALIADADLLARMEAVAPAERETFSFAMGPMTLGFSEFSGMRLNEHAFHTWDIDVAVDPAATIPSQVAVLVVDNLELVARYTGKPTGDTITIGIATNDPRRAFTIDLTPDAATFTTSPADDTTGDLARLELPAEAFARLVYGRLDPAHTPPDIEGQAIAILRKVFPGP
jgi:uncharacterized protein (TIGR03083 family)